MIDFLKKIALDFENEKTKKYFEKRINKFSEDLASKDVLLIDVNEMESLYNPEKVVVEDSDESINKITLEM